MLQDAACTGAVTVSSGAVGATPEDRVVADRDRARVQCVCLSEADDVGLFLDVMVGVLPKMPPMHCVHLLLTHMSYHRFPNPRQMYSGDLGSKLAEGLQSQHFPTSLPCNCTGGNLRDACASSVATVAARALSTRSPVGCAGNFTSAAPTNSSKTAPMAISTTRKCRLMGEAIGVTHSCHTLPVIST